MVTLGNLVGTFPIEPLSQIEAAILISGLVTDSRKASPGCIFFAIPGVHVDGHDFILQTIEAGSSVVVHEKDLPEPIISTARLKKTILIRVKQVRRVLSYASAQWFDRPSDSMTVVGVTGTDGKSSTVYFINQLLEAAGVQSGFFSTVAMQTGSEPEANGLRQSTPEAPELHEILASMRQNGKTHAVIESTSHGLSHKTNRLRDVSFLVGVFTNLSHEHLEFHGSYEQYRSDKANLFRELRNYEHGKPDSSPFSVVNAADAEANYFIEASRFPVLTYASELGSFPVQQATLYADKISSHSDFCSCMLTYDPSFVKGDGLKLQGEPFKVPVTVPLPGTFNIENVMAALLTVSGLVHRTPLELIPFLDKLRGVKGRMVPISLRQPFSLIIDYAHTPGSYSKILPMFRESTKGKLIAVFGSAGERDVEKRPMQGKLAAQYCDILILTNEDPRLEDEMTIISQIRDGAVQERPEVKILCIPDRKRAITEACRLAGAGDTVMLLGKGHEQSIFGPTGKQSWDEEKVAREVLAEIGWN